MVHILDRSFDHVSEITLVFGRTALEAFFQSPQHSYLTLDFL